MDERARRAASFEHGVAAYQTARPGYPDDVVRWCVPHDACDVLDLAAGTGKLTARLVAFGYDVVAVEPSDAMRAELERTVPDADARPGTAEATGLPDACVDAVTVLTLPADERDVLLDRVDDLVAHHPDLRGREEVDVPYVTRAWRATLR